MTENIRDAAVCPYAIFCRHGVSWFSPMAGIKSIYRILTMRPAVYLLVERDEGQAELPKKH